MPGPSNGFWIMLRPARSSRTLLVLALGAMAAGLLCAAEPADRQVLELPEAIALALAHNPSVGAARAAVRASRARMAQTASAFLPHLSFQRQEQRSFARGADKTAARDGSAGAFRNYTSLERSNVSLSGLIYDFQRTPSQVRASRQTFHAAAHGEESRRAQTIQQVHVAYIGVLLAQRLRAIARETTRQRRELFAQVQKLFDGGLRPKFDLSRASIDLESARLAEIQSEAALSRARFDLNNAIGLPDLATRPLRDVLEEPVATYEVAAVVKDAVARRPETRAAEARLRAAQHSLAASRAAYFPRVELNATYGHNAPTEVAGAADDWSAGVEARVPLFDLAATRHVVRETEALVTQSREELREQENTVIQDVQQRFVELEEARARVSEAELLVRQAIENLSLARQRYESGVGRIIDVTDAQLNWTSALQALDRARSDLHGALARLKRAAHLYEPEYFPRTLEGMPPNAPPPPSPAAGAAPPATADSVRALGDELLEGGTWREGGRGDADR